jgi:hypothetical protein
MKTLTLHIENRSFLKSKEQFVPGQPGTDEEQEP